jgi:hypothetical protein
MLELTITFKNNQTKPNQTIRNSTYYIKSCFRFQMICIIDLTIISIPLDLLRHKILTQMLRDMGIMQLYSTFVSFPDLLAKADLPMLTLLGRPSLEGLVLGSYFC